MITKPKCEAKHMLESLVGLQQHIIIRMQHAYIAFYINKLIPGLESLYVCHMDAALCNARHYLL